MIASYIACHNDRIITKANIKNTHKEKGKQAFAIKFQESIMQKNSFSKASIYIWYKAYKILQGKFI